MAGQFYPHGIVGYIAGIFTQADKSEGDLPSRSGKRELINYMNEGR
jgi:hypothetical protein